MSIKSTGLPIAAAVVLALTGGAFAVPQLLTAQASKGASDLDDVHQVQQLSIANDGAYAPSLQALTGGDLGLKLSPRKGSEVAYMVGESRQGYVFAEKLTSGRVVVGSDTGEDAVTCDALTPECIAKVSTDPELISAVPEWVKF